jgi:hypothetical protein
MKTTIVKNALLAAAGRPAGPLADEKCWNRVNDVQAPALKQ